MDSSAGQEQDPVHPHTTTTNPAAISAAAPAPVQTAVPTPTIQAAGSTQPPLAPPQATTVRAPVSTQPPAPSHKPVAVQAVPPTTARASLPTPNQQAAQVVAAKPVAQKLVQNPVQKSVQPSVVPAQTAQKPPVQQIIKKQDVSSATSAVPKTTAAPVQQIPRSAAVVQPPKQIQTAAIAQQISEKPAAATNVVLKPPAQAVGKPPAQQIAKKRDAPSAKSSVVAKPPAQVPTSAVGKPPAQQVSKKRDTPSATSVVSKPPVSTVASASAIPGVEKKQARPPEKKQKTSESPPVPPEPSTPPSLLNTTQLLLPDYPAIRQMVHDIIALLQKYGPLTLAQLEYNLPPVTAVPQSCCPWGVPDILAILVSLQLIHMNNEQVFYWNDGVPREDVVQPAQVLPEIAAAVSQAEEAWQRGDVLRQALLESANHRDVLKQLLADSPDLVNDPVYLTAFRCCHIDVGKGGKQGGSKSKSSKSSGKSAKKTKVANKPPATVAPPPVQPPPPPPPPQGEAK